MGLSEKVQLEVKDALNGKFPDTLEALEKLLENLDVQKKNAGGHGSMKRIDNIMSKVRARITRLKE